MFELPFDPNKLNDRDKRQMMRDNVRTTKSSYNAKEAAWSHFMSCLSDPVPNQSEIEDARLRVMDTTEAHLDNLIGHRGIVRTLKLDRGRNGY